MKQQKEGRTKHSSLPIDRPELIKFGRNRNFVNRQILLKKMTTRLIIIILDCAGYISTFKAVIVVTAALYN